MADPIENPIRWIDECKTHCYNSIANTSVGVWLKQAIEGLEYFVSEAAKFESCLQACSQRLQKILPIGEVKHIGLLEIPAGIDQLHAENERLREKITNHNNLDKEYKT